MFCGYNIDFGYFGLVGNDYILFSTENEYYEYLTEMNSEQD